MITIKTDIVFGENKGLKQIEIEQHSSLVDLLLRLNLPMDMHFFILVNGNYQNMNYVLCNDDCVKILPFLDGG